MIRERSGGLTFNSLLTQTLFLSYICVCVCITNSKFKIWEKAFVFNNSLMTTAIVKVMGEG